MDAINDDMGKSGAIVPRDGGMRAFIGATGLGEFMSFDPKTKEGGRMLVAATLSEPEDLAEMVNREIVVSNFYAHDVESNKPSGEVESWTRIVIFTDTGIPYSCGSLGVRKCLGVLFNVRGPMPWIPGVKCTVKVRRLDGAKNWMTLEPDMDSLYPEHVGKK